MKEIVGGNASALQFYDGADYDVFVLSVGLHHFMCIAFDGEGGSRQFGGVNRYGRRAAEDLIAVLGASAWIIEKPQEPEVRRKSELRAPGTPAPQEEEELVLEVASFGDDVVEAEPEMPKMEAIDDNMFNVDDLFGDMPLEDDMSLFDDLEAIEDIAKEDDTNRKGTIDWDDAIRIGLIKGGSTE